MISVTWNEPDNMDTTCIRIKFPHDTQNNVNNESVASLHEEKNPSNKMLPH